MLFSPVLPTMSAPRRACTCTQPTTAHSLSSKCQLYLPAQDAPSYLAPSCRATSHHPKPACFRCGLPTAYYHLWTMHTLLVVHRPPPTMQHLHPLTHHAPSTARRARTIAARTSCYPQPRYASPTYQLPPATSRRPTTHEHHPHRTTYQLLPTDYTTYTCSLTTKHPLPTRLPPAPRHRPTWNTTSQLSTVHHQPVATTCCSLPARH